MVAKSTLGFGRLHIYDKISRNEKVTRREDFFLRVFVHICFVLKKILPDPRSSGRPGGKEGF